VGAARVLVLDDDDFLRQVITERLSRSGFAVSAASNVAQARADLQREAPDIALLDVKLPDGEGTELLPELSEAEIPCVMMTAHGTVQSAVAALKNGARDYLEKPFSLEKLEATLAAALEVTSLRREVHSLRQQYASSGIIVGSSLAMNDVLRVVEKLAPADSTTVLIEGETGTGKGVIARLIHQLSGRAKGPFINVTCSSLATKKALSPMRAP
jgi:DNA-binding NtrC family response regulator